MLWDGRVSLLVVAVVASPAVGGGISIEESGDSMEAGEVGDSRR